MQNQKNREERKKEIINICLNQFLENGLYDTSTRDLAGVLNMQPSGLYYYFASKDDIVVACAEEAGLRLEDVLLMPVLESLNDANQMVEVIEKKMEEAVPMMKFFAQACTITEYRVQMQPVLDRMKKRHKEYAKLVAKELNCESEEVAPYLYACVAVVSNYMIFGEEIYYRTPFELIANSIHNFKERMGQKTEEK